MNGVVKNEHIVHGNVHRKETKTNFDRLLQVYPTDIVSKPPIFSQVSSILDTSKAESKRLITRWRQRQMMLRVESLSEHFRNVPTDQMIDNMIYRLGWTIPMKPSYYLQIQHACAGQRRGYFLSNILTETETNKIKSLILSQKWPSLFIKHNLSERGRGVFAYADITKYQVVCNYEGKHMTHSEGERKYLEVGGCYFFKFQFNSTYHYIDCSAENETYGRLINHSAIHPNIKPVPKNIQENKPDVIFVALQDIKVGEELFWNYGKKAQLDFYDQCFCKICKGHNTVFPIMDNDDD